jgi:IS5 family transposase
VKGTKTSLVTDEAGWPVKLSTDAGGRHDLYACGSIPYSLPKGSILVADRGYDARWFRQKLRKHGIQPRIRKRSWKGRRKSPKNHLGRWKIERTFAWFHKFRKLLIRWERKASHWKAFWFLACVQLILPKLTE